MSEYKYKTVPINIRVQEEVKLSIVGLADKEHRSISNMVEKILKEYIAKIQEEKPF